MTDNEDNMTDPTGNTNLARETSASGVGHCRNCKGEFIRPNKRFKVCKNCRIEKKRALARKKYHAKKTTPKCKKCGQDVVKEEGHIRTRIFCKDCRVRKARANIRLICHKCNQPWILAGTTKRENFPPCYNCREIKTKNSGRNRSGHLPRPCKICNIQMNPPGYICGKCKHLNRKSIATLNNIRREEILQFHYFMTLINSRGGMASKEEIFIDLLGWAGVFLSVERYGGSINNQIERMWRDLNKVWVGIKQQL